jgi:hypothetical protein
VLGAYYHSSSKDWALQSRLQKRNCDLLERSSPLIKLHMWYLPENKSMPSI